MPESVKITAEQTRDALSALARLLGRQAAAEIVGKAQPTYALGTDTNAGTCTSEILTSTST